MDVQMLIKNIILLLYDLRITRVATLSKLFIWTFCKIFSAHSLSTSVFCCSDHKFFVIGNSCIKKLWLQYFGSAVHLFHIWSGRTLGADVDLAQTTKFQEIEVWIWGCIWGDRCDIEYIPFSLWFTPLLFYSAIKFNYSTLTSKCGPSLIWIQDM